MPAEIRIVAEHVSGMDGWSVYDGSEWFAHTTSRTEALRYASDLLYEGSGPRGSVWRLLEAMETKHTPATTDAQDPQSKSKPGSGAAWNTDAQEDTTP